MGYKETKEMAKGFKQKTNKAVEDLKQPGLFASASVETNLTFECIREPADADVRVGDVVLIIDMRDKIEVFKQQIGVGFVVAADSFRGSVVLSESNGSAVHATVFEVSELGPTFMVRIHSH